MSDLRTYTSAPSTEEKDETYKRIISKKNVPEVGAGSLMFRLVSAEPKDFSHFMKFWLNIGQKDNGKFNTIPRVSALPFTDFLVADGRGGTRVAKTGGMAKGCRLSALAEQRHPLIALSEYKDSKGAFKINVDASHVARVQVIQRKRDPQGRAVKNADGSPAFVVQPEEMFLEMPQSWFDQLVNIIDPIAAPAGGADDDLRGETKAPKALPTKDLTRVIWMMTKEKRTKNPTGNVKTDVDYVLDFAGTTTLKDADMVPLKDPIDIAKAFMVVNDEDLNRWISSAEAGWPRTTGAQGARAGHPSEQGSEAEDDPERYGQRVDGPANSAAASASGGEERFE